MIFHLYKTLVFGKCILEFLFQKQLTIYVYVYIPKDIHVFKVLQFKNLFLLYFLCLLEIEMHSDSDRIIVFGTLSGYIKYHILIEQFCCSFTLKNISSLACRILCF